MVENASNAMDQLHNEEYERPYLFPLLDHQSLIFMGGRRTESLAGDWRFAIDPFDTGLRQKWYREDDRPLELRILTADWDPGAGRTVPVPSCWNLIEPEWKLYEGAAWYCRDLDWTPGPEGERVFLRVGAAAQEARIFLNGRFLGRHRGGSTPFFVELTDLRAGSNRLMLMVDNKRGRERVPMRHFDWFNYGGVYREIELLRLPPRFIKDLRVELVPNSDFRRIRVAVALSDESPAAPARLAIPELGVEAEIEFQEGRGALELEADPQLWSPASPKLYDLSVTWEADRVVDRVGFREIRAEGVRILLNGAPVYLRGACVHEDHPDLGKMIDEPTVRRMLTDARDLGGNFLRLSHYPHHELAAKLADEIGVLLWAEIPVYWAIDFANAATYADAENQMLEMMTRDHNRASVILWGVGNENADTDARLSFMGRLARCVKQADPTRLVSAACLINREAKRIEDRLAAHLDVIGINEYYGWYEPEVADLAAIGRNSDPGKPVLISETGADAPSGHHGGLEERYTEEFQANYYRRQMEILNDIPWIQGIAVWLLYDFRSERRQNPFQRGLNRKGIVTFDRKTRKLAFSTLAQLFGALAEEGR
jgi:beta-glucuronidase